MGKFETYDVPPPYSTYNNAPSQQYQAPARYAPPPGPPPSLRTTMPPASSAYSSTPYAGSPYGSRQTYNAIPEEHQATSELTQQSRSNAQLPSPSSSSQADDQEVDEIAAHYRQYMQPAPSAGGFFTTHSSSTTLTRPILIPQAYAASFHRPPAPFVRAYPPVLASRDIGISPALFVAIVDALNLCLAPPPPLQALNLVGQGVGLVPHHIAQGVSLGLGVVSGVGVAATRIIKQKKFLAKVNADVFGPRGLVMEVAKDEAALRSVGVEGHRLPMPRPQMTGPGSSCNGSLNAASQTRLTQLAPYTAPLSFDVPPAAVPASLMDRISARQAASRLAKDAKRGEKQQQKREEEMRKMAGRRSSSSSSSSSSSDSDDDSDIHAQFDAKRQKAEQKGDWKEVAKIEKKRAKEIEDYQKKQRKHEKKHGSRREDKHQKKYEKKMDEINKEEHEQVKKDQKKMGKLLWIVIRPAVGKVEEHRC